MPMDKEELLYFSELIRPQTYTADIGIETSYRKELDFTAISLQSCVKKYQLEQQVLDPKEQLRILIPFFSPVIQCFTKDLYYGKIPWDSVFPSKSDEYLLSYCYFNILLATQHIDMSSYDTRVASFESREPRWPLRNHLSGEKMAEYGFFRREPYEKQQTTCFTCGCVLSDWVATDTALDGHAQFRPQCPFVWIMVFLKKALMRSRSHNHNDSFDDPREISSLQNHSQLLTDQVRRRLLKFLSWFDVMEMSSKQLIDKDIQSLVIARDIFHFKTMDILFTVWKKAFRYWNTLKSIVSDRDMAIEIKNLFPTGAVLIKDLLQNRRNAAHLPYIPGGMPPCSQFVLPPVDGGLSIIKYLKNIANDPNLTLDSQQAFSRMADQSVRYPQVSNVAGVNSSLSTFNSERANFFAINQNVSNRGAEDVRTRGQSLQSNAMASYLTRLSSDAEKALMNRICVQCMRKSSVYLMLPCRHLSMCSDCVSDPKKVSQCPACRNDVTDCIRIYNS